jgi:hypothetical protein
MPSGYRIGAPNGSGVPFAIRMSNGEIKCHGQRQESCNQPNRYNPDDAHCPVSAGCGMSSTAQASSTAAKIIGGNARRKTVRKLFAQDRTPAIKAPPHVSAAGISMIGVDERVPEFPHLGIRRGRKPKSEAALSPVSTRPVAAGTTTKVMASTNTFNAVEANIAASVPSSVFRRPDLVGGRRRSVARNVRAAGPKRNENSMPIRCTSSQLTAVRRTRSG